jgi:hypothetical protein
MDIYLTATIPQFDDKLNQQKEVTERQNSLHPMVGNIFVKNYEEIALATADYKSEKWITYIDGTFMVWPHGPERLQQFLHRPNSLRPAMTFRMEAEVSNTTSSS